MKKSLKYCLGICLCLSLTGLSAQNMSNSQGGKFALGLGFNPISGIKANADFKAGDFVGNAIAAEASVPYQMFILGQQPMVAISSKYQLNEKTALKGSIGFSGAYFNYLEYVIDDAARFQNSLSEAVVTDQITFHLSGGGVSLGLEFGSNAGKRLRITGAASLLYSYGGAVIRFNYGNAMTEINREPSCIKLIADSLNMYATNGDMAYARPIKRYNVGFEQGLGLMLDCGAEYFITPKLSLGLNATITPIMVAFQPQTYTIYEGFSTLKGEVMEYNKLISPGSTSVLYGTENLGLVVSLHYYLK